MSVCNRAVRNQGTEKITSRFSHSSDIEGDSLQLDAACTRVLVRDGEPRHTLSKDLVQSVLELNQIDWITACGESRHGSALVQQFDQCFPAGILIPNVVGFEGGKQDSQLDLSFG